MTRFERQAVRLTTQCQDSHTSGHLALYQQWRLQDKLLDPLHSAGLDDRRLVPLAAGCQVSER